MIVGGYELDAYDLAHRLHCEGYQVAVASSPVFGDSTRKNEAFDVFRTLQCTDHSPEILRNADLLQLGLFINLHNVAAMEALVTDWAPDVIVCFNLNGLGPFGLLHLFHSLGHHPIWRIGDTLAAAKQCRSEIARFAKVFGTAEVFKNINFTAPASRVLDELSQDVGLTMGPIHLWPGSFRRRQPVDTPWRASSEELRLIFASRIESHKGTDLLLEAAHRVRSRGVTNFHIDVFGAGRVAQFQQNIYARNLEEVVSYQGVLPKSKMLDRFHDYDALLFPTWEREPFGSVVVEAAVAGCIPILTATIGVGEWMADGVDCIKIRRDPQNLADAVVDLAHQEPVRRNAFRARVKRNARAMFESDQGFAKMTELFEAVAKGRSEPATAHDRILTSLAMLAHIWRRHTSQLDERDVKMDSLVQIDSLKADVRELHAFINALVGSMSWKVTTPLRVLERVGSRFRKIIGA
jgi:glycogen synthase